MAQRLQNRASGIKRDSIRQGPHSRSGAEHFGAEQCHNPVHQILLCAPAILHL